MAYNHVILSFGSNDFLQGKDNIYNAIEFLTGRFGRFIASSDIYTSKPFGLNSGEKDYYNCVGLYETFLTIDELEKELKRLEILMGRIKNMKTHEVPLDIDIVIWNDDLIRPSEYKRDYFRKGYEQLNFPNV